MKGSIDSSRRLHLYVVNFSHITSFYAIFTMIPYLNMELGISGMMYALSFAGYYITMLISYFYQESISDRFGRRKSLLVSLCGLCICNLIGFTSSNPFVYIAMRSMGGFFDCVNSISHAYAFDILSMKDCELCLSQLQFTRNAAQCIGPLIAGFISIKSVTYAIYFGIASEIIGFVYSCIFLPESLESVCERRKLSRPFSLARKAAKRSILNDSLLEETHREMDMIQHQFLANSRKEKNAKIKESKLEVNYLIIIVLFCEFCNSCLLSVFNTIVCQYGKQKHNLSAFYFSLLSTIGSAINIFQSGYLFRLLINSYNMSIPRFGSFSGIIGIIACVLCIWGNTLFYWIGSVFLIVAYGFYAPVSPAVMSAENNEYTHTKALLLVHMSSQLAHIISPLLLQQLYIRQADTPFTVTLIPSFLILVMLLLCEILPGGKTAGQISLQATLEHSTKLGFLQGDNEMESIYLGHAGHLDGNDEKKKFSIPPRTPQNTNVVSYHTNMEPMQGSTGMDRQLSFPESNMLIEEMEI